MKKILFAGPPGSGKGTQAKLLSDYGFLHVSSGDLIRNSTDPEIVRYREVLYPEGKLLEDKKLFQLIEENLPKNKNYILDGTVRTINQAKHAKEKNWFDVVINFILPEETAVKRILKRNVGRADDNKISVKKRFREYREKTEPTNDYLKENFEYYEVDASKSIEEVHKKVLKILNL